MSETTALESKVTELEALLKVKSAAVVGTGSGSGSGSQGQSPGHGQVVGMITVGGGDRDGEGVMQGNYIISYQ